MELYEAIYTRRDIREFRPDDVPDGVLHRILDAAHHAGSVGFMQPWNFTIVRSASTKQRIAQVYTRENQRAAENYSGPQKDLYESVTQNSIEQAPVGVAVTCDRDRNGPAVLGRNTMPETDLYSTCCAIQNLWLAARAENVGMCWVSILDPDEVKAILKIPDQIVLVAYLCLGYPEKFDDQPLLERRGWQTRTPLDELVFSEQWQTHWSYADSKPVSKPK
jgi:5,6-dimethylbenzimidazole synthase